MESNVPFWRWFLVGLFLGILVWVAFCLLVLVVIFCCG